MKKHEIKSLFLGPKAENRELYISVINEIIEDACFLRKNFHPEDLPIINEIDKLTEDFKQTSAFFKQNMQSILAELKKGVPLYHPRYIGHMHGDLLIPAVAAYFGTMLYNSNNVVGESSPATTKMEFEFINQLARMVGYPELKNLDVNNEQSWGHLTSGGTTANIEALWLARNMKYYPIAVKLATLIDDDVEMMGIIRDLHINFLNKTIDELTFNELFSLSPNCIVSLKELIYKKVKSVKEVKEKINKYEIIKLGVHGIHKLVEDKGMEILLLPKLYFPKSYHYSWNKAIEILGIGHDQVVHVPLDIGYRMDYDKFVEVFNNETPTLAVIGVLGSSKQGSIDPIDKLVNFRKSLEENEKKSFYFHIDGAYGGYFCSLLRDENFNEISFDDFYKEYSLNKDWYNKVKQVKNSDSITIDPHKMGYIPYPAGSVIFSDTRYKDFISYLPSYLNTPEDSKNISEAFLGQWTLEGSRPGATATACYLASKVLPYHKDAHGIIIKNTFEMTNIFVKSIEKYNNNSSRNKGYKIIQTYVPETNIVSYVFSLPNIIKNINHLNILTKKLYDKFSIKGDTIISSVNFMVAKEEFEYKDINHTDFLEKSGIETPKDSEKIVIFSSVFMNPLSKYIDDTEYYDKFWDEMTKYSENILSEIMFEIVTEKNQKRINLLWVENDNEIDRLNTLLQHDSNIGRFINVDFINDVEDCNNKLNRSYDIYIFDLNLQTNSHEKDTVLENISDSIKLIKKINEKEKILLYSKYFTEDSTKTITELELNKIHTFQDFQKIPKKEFNGDLQFIIRGVFKIIENQ